MKKPSGYEKTLEIIKGTRELSPADAIPILVECAKKCFPLASEKAVQVLGRLNHPEIITALIDLYNWIEQDAHKRDRSCSVRIAIAEAMGDIASPFAIDTLRRAIRTVQITRLGPGPEDVAIGLRATAAIALAKVDDSCLFELSILLFDEEPAIPTSPRDRMFVKAPVRKAAAQALNILGDPGGMNILAIKLKFPQGETEEVLAECLESLIPMRPPYLMEVVKPYLNHENTYLASITALALAENLGAEVLPLLHETLASVGNDAKETLVIAIAATRAENTRSVLLELLESNNNYVRLGAVKGIKAYMDNEIRERLQIISETDANAEIRKEAGLEIC